MTATLQPHLDSIAATASSLSNLPFNTIPTHFIASLLHQSGVDNLIRDPHPHERGLFTVRPQNTRHKENIPLGDGEGKVIRTRTERERISPLLLPKYSSGGNVEADVFLKTAGSLLEIYPVTGTKDRIEGMMRRFGELTDEVGRLEGLVDDQRRELEMQNSSRLGGVYDDEDTAVTQAMVEEEEEQVRLLEEKIKAMHERIRNLDARMASV